MPWQNIEGHDDVVHDFRQALRRGRLGHAYLFVGLAGIGKRLFARTLAQALLCEQSDETTLEPCALCPGCVQVKAGSHPDLIQIARGADEHSLPIETVRGVIHDLGFKPARGRYKIAIVDDADDMQHEAANCLLKCLEEPPPRSLLILLGTSPDRQLPTIRSRCQVVRFQPPPKHLVAAVLLKTGVVNDPAHAEQLAAQSGGSLERARGLADPELWEFRAELWRSLTAKRLDSVALAERMNAIIEAASKESAEKRTRARLLLSLATEFLDASLRSSVGAPVPPLDPTAPNATADLAERCSPEAIAELIERCLEADYEIDRKASLPLVVEAWADQMASR